MSKEFSFRKDVYQIVPADGYEQSKGSLFCKVMAVIAWVFGFFVAISTASAVSMTFDNFYNNSSFSFSAFFSTMTPFFLAGGALFCAAELLENVNRIAFSMCNLRVVQVHENEDQANKNQHSNTYASPISVVPATIDKTHMNNNRIYEPVNVNVEDNVIAQTIKPGQARTIVRQLQNTEIQWVDFSDLGTWGQKLVDMGICVNAEINAPVEMTEVEARENGFTNWSSDNGQKRFWKPGKLVPRITPRELYTLVDK